MSISINLRVPVNLCVLVFLTSVPLLVCAQDSSNDVYQRYATVPTEVPGISTFAEPPRRFNPISASDEELAMYGFPPRPDKITNPEAYGSWLSIVRVAKTRWKGSLRVTELSNAKPSNRVLSDGSNAIASTPVSLAANNQVQNQSVQYGGFTNIKNISVYSTAKTTLASIRFALAIYNVPIVQDAHGQSGCVTPGTEGTVEASVGIDWPTLEAGTIAQLPWWAILPGGCVVFPPTYYAEMGAGTSSSIIEAFPVNPGDTMITEVWNTSATTGYVYLWDLTTETGSTYAITLAPIIGKWSWFMLSRIYINGTLDQLPNFVADLWTDTYAIDFDNEVYGPGTNLYLTSNYLWTVHWQMTDDVGDQVITNSVPYVQVFPNSYNPHKPYGVFFTATGCAYNYGCNP